VRNTTRNLRNRTKRERAIRAILDGRFSVRAFEDIRREDRAYWDSPGNDMGRGIYAQAMREKQRLSKVTDELLLAEIAALRPPGGR
jgi:hypothetical protein